MIRSRANATAFSCSFSGVELYNGLLPKQNETARLMISFWMATATRATFTILKLVLSPSVEITFCAESASWSLLTWTRLSGRITWLLMLCNRMSNALLAASTSGCGIKRHDFNSEITSFAVANLKISSIVISLWIKFDQITRQHSCACRPCAFQSSRSMRPGHHRVHSARL